MSENIVKKVCAELGITQVELAKMLDLPQSTITNWTRGQSPQIAKTVLNLLLENKKKDQSIKIIKQFKDMLKDL